jgi:predicted enzyme related to lactoylglutathione lyase
MHPAHTITQYVLVPSVTKHMAKVEKLGGSICKPKTAVPGAWVISPSARTPRTTRSLSGK